MKPFRSLMVGSLAFLAIGSTSVRANIELIADGGFENPPAPAGGYSQYFGGTSFGGWTTLGQDVLVLSTTYSEASVTGVNQFNAQGGSNSLDITGAGNTSPANGVQQTVATTVGANYLLSFYVGRAESTFPKPNYYDSSSTVLLSLDNGVTTTAFTNSDSTLGQVNWKLFLYSFTATSSSTLITFLNGTPVVPAGNNFAGLDDVSLTAVPEPSTIGAFALGGIGILYHLRRRRATV